ncbi:MAG: redoxin domain-containing protein [Planctomycetia bacterium]|nr:redoxin domain-containing protein [Planctomycetia bacterium]
MKKILSLALGLMLANLAIGAEAADLKAGDPAPDFSLVGSDGKTYNLADFKDKSAVVVAWYPKAFTGGCTAECKNMKAEGAKIRNFNVAYFTASVDDVKKNTDFANSLDLDYPILSDPSKKTATDYGILNDKGFSNRVTFYIGADGKLLYIDKGVKTGSHGADIAAKLAELGVPKK